MKAMVTKKMVQEINKASRKNGWGMTAHFITASDYEYRMYVGDMYRNIMDYDSRIGMMKVIGITYPDEYYALPAYVTTKDLQNILANASGNTLDEFMNEFYATYAI